MADLGAIGASYGLGSDRVRAAPAVLLGAGYAGPVVQPTAVPMPKPLLGKATSTYRRAPSMPGTPTWYGGARPVGAEPVAVYRVAGTVKQRLNGVDSPLMGCLVRLYARRTGMPVGAATTAADGSFSVDGLLPESQGFFAIAFDPDGAPVQNALIFDRLQALPSVPGEIVDQSFALSVGLSITATLKAVYLVGVITFTVTAGALPDGLTLSPSGVLSGTPTAGGEFSFTVTATGSVYGSASRTWTVEVQEGLAYFNTLQGAGTLSLVRQGQADEGFIVLPALPFGFSLFGTTYQNNIYACANSFISFGFGVSVYSGISPTNPGRALLLGTADRSWKTLYAGTKLDGNCFLVRFEGSTVYHVDDSTNIWEVGFYPDGSISVVTGPFPNDGVKEISDGASYRSTATPTFAANRAYLGQPTGPGGNFVWTDTTP